VMRQMRRLSKMEVASINSCEKDVFNPDNIRVQERLEELQRLLDMFEEQEKMKRQVWIVNDNQTDNGTGGGKP